MNISVGSLYPHVLDMYSLVRLWGGGGGVLQFTFWIMRLDADGMFGKIV